MSGDPGGWLVAVDGAFERASEITTVPGPGDEGGSDALVRAVRAEAAEVTEAARTVAPANRKTSLIEVVPSMRSRMSLLSLPRTMSTMSCVVARDARRTAALSHSWIIGFWSRGGAEASIASMRDLLGMVVGLSPRPRACPRARPPPDPVAAAWSPSRWRLRRSGLLEAS